MKNINISVEIDNINVEGIEYGKSKGYYEFNYSIMINDNLIKKEIYYGDYSGQSKEDIEKKLNDFLAMDKILTNTDWQKILINDINK